MILSLPTLAEPQHFSLIEKLLFAALAIASGYAFWRRFGTILHKILKSKKDPSFHLFPIGKRIWDFFWEVLCQAKVIRERPLARPRPRLRLLGLLRLRPGHAQPLRRRPRPRLSSPDGVIGRFYFYFAAAFALACAVGILGLFVRRFLVRPNWLGEKLSWESGFIALLIFLLMATYLAAFFVADTSPTARVLWWAHTLTLLIFLPLIPHTKHLHLSSAPPLSFSRAAASARFLRSRWR